MAKNTPDPITVSAVDPRQVLANQMDDIIMTCESRNRAIAAQRKQLDLETQANDDAIHAARTAMNIAEERLQAARELQLTEQA